MAQKLEGEEYCTMELPQQYGRKFASAVNAGAKVLGGEGRRRTFYRDFHVYKTKTTHLGMYPYWYELGIKLALAMPKDCERITKMLNDAFLERYIEIFKYVHALFFFYDRANVGKRNKKTATLRIGEMRTLGR